MALTDFELKNLKPRVKAFKQADGFGLYIQVMPNGSKLWRSKYRVHGEERRLSMGRYPDVSLADARKLNADARAIVAAGRDPAVERKKEKLKAAISLKTTFDAVAREFIEHKMAGEGHAQNTIDKATWFLKLLKPLHDLPVAQIEPAELLEALKRIAGRGQHYTARRCLSFSSRVFRYAIQTLRASNDPAAALRGALRNPKVKHHAAIQDPKKVGELLRAIEHYDGHEPTRYALLIAPHVMARPGELRNADWREFDLEKAEWKVPAERMKTRKPHMVPLSRQVIGYLKELFKLTGPAGYLFPALSTSKRPMSENTMNQAFRRMGFSKEEMTSHGWRSTASTLLNESGRWPVDAIEHSLAHNDPNAVRGAYNRGGYWPERIRMHQWWSDHLDKLRGGDDEAPFGASPNDDGNVIDLAARRELRSA